jgi:hypothetical protein
MNEAMTTTAESTAVDDVRRIRDEFSKASGGDIRRHAEQTRAAFQKLQSQLQLRTVAPPGAVSSTR